MLETSVAALIATALMEAAVTIYTPNTILRFWAKVDKRGPDECWLWTAGTTSAGYGKIKLEKMRVDQAAHVMSYELANGDIPDDLWVLHTCDTPACVNPNHLYAGTSKDNVRDMHERKRWGRHDPDANRGHRNPVSRLTLEQALEVKRRIASGEPNTVIAADYDIHHSTVSAIKRRKIWCHLGG